MDQSIQKQMFIIFASCWKCENDMNVAVINCDSKMNKGFYGPESFSEEEKKIAENNNVIIREQFSYTKEESYNANICPHCNSFVGQHYLFVEYFVSAVDYGDYEYKVIDLS